MGLNPYLLELAKSRAKQANFEPGQPMMTDPPVTKMGPAGPRGPFTLAGRGLDRVGGAMLRHPLLTVGTGLALVGGKKLYDDYTKPTDTTKQADVPPTPMSAPNRSAGMPPAPIPPPTNAAPIPPSPAQNFGQVTNDPSQQVDQAKQMVTTSQGAANVPKPTQGAAQRAPGLVSGGGT